MYIVKVTKLLYIIKVLIVVRLAKLFFSKLKISLYA